MFENDVPLSPAGAERRERILELAKRQARGRRYRRRGVRIGVGCAGLLLAVLFVWLGRPGSRMVVELPLPKSVAPAAGVTITFIQTDPTIVDRLSVRPTRRWVEIDDDQLLHSLADAGHPSGLISVGGQTFLLPR